MTNEQKVYKFLKENMRLNTAAAVGIITNIYYESGFRTTVYGDEGTSYGLCQWHAGRFDNLKRWCKDNGYNYTTVEGQMNFLKHELETDYDYVLNKVANVEDTADGAYNAAYYWCKYFEVPADTEATAKRRGSYAENDFWPKYAGDAEDDDSDQPVKPTKSIDEVAHEVIDGEWGNGEERERKLTDAGYDYDAVQARVNEILTGNSKLKVIKASQPAMSFDGKIARAYKVNAKSGLNIRDGAGMNYEILVAIPYGHKVDCYGYFTKNNEGVWYYIETEYNNKKYIGFANSVWLS